MGVTINYLLTHITKINKQYVYETIILLLDFSSNLCAPPQLVLNGTESGGILTKRYTDIREVKFFGEIGPLGEQRLCKIKCIAGQWVGPLCSDQQGNKKNTLIKFSALHLCEIKKLVFN